MKLASLNRGRDGELLVVSRDLKRMTSAADIAPSLQDCLDNWARVSPRLELRYQQLNDGDLPGQPFAEAGCASPLPRAYQWIDGSAYLNHVELVRRARGAEMPEAFWREPLLYQGGSDSFLPPQANIVLADADWGLDFEAEVAVVCDDVPMAVSSEQAATHIRLLMLVNDISLRNLIPGELAKGFGFFQSKPSSSFSPLAITPDELGESWQGGRLALPLLSYLNGELFGCPNAGCGMHFNFAELIAHAAKTRRLSAGSIVGSGTVSNKLEGGPGKPVSEGGLGYSCIAEQRMVEKILHGEMRTPFLQRGDRLRIEMRAADGQSLFGAIDQQVVAPEV